MHGATAVKNSSAVAGRKRFMRVLPSNCRDERCDERIHFAVDTRAAFHSYRPASIHNSTGSQAQLAVIGASTQLASIGFALSMCQTMHNPLLHDFCHQR